MTKINDFEELQNLEYKNRPELSFHILFALQFLFIVAGMYINVKVGVSTLALVFFMTAVTLLKHGNNPETNWKPAKNAMVYLFIVWGVYCVLELGNPNNVQDAWNITIAHYWVYPTACAILVPLTIRDKKGIEYLLFIWSAFILIITFKGYWQKNQGFNPGELYFLYVMGGARTHIIWSGIRYFSCFSDAATYGVHSAMALTVFSMSAFFVKQMWKKVYFILIAGCGLYSMFISGTRSAIAIPFGALLLFILISKNWKYFISGGVVIIAAFCFFSFTNIGDSNSYIRKMRSAFHPSKDASYLLRVENRKKMKEAMASKPFGYGVGLSKSERFKPHEPMPFPPDSWLVSVWVETGIVGLVIYLLIHATLFAWCSWILMFKVMNKRVRGLVAAWLCMAAGFFISAYTNDVMQYPNSIPLYVAFALCFAAPNIDKATQGEEEKENKEKQRRKSEELEIYA